MKAKAKAKKAQVIKRWHGFDPQSKNLTISYGSKRKYVSEYIKAMSGSKFTLVVIGEIHRVSK